MSIRQVMGISESLDTYWYINNNPMDEVIRGFYFGINGTLKVSLPYIDKGIDSYRVKIIRISLI
jgi:hypothetical protein